MAEEGPPNSWEVISDNEDDAISSSFRTASRASTWTWEEWEEWRKSNKTPMSGSTDREFVPLWDGTPPMKTYERKVEIYEMKTKTPPEERAIKLLERLTEDAFDATETLDIQSLKTPDGVQKLLAFLRNVMEPIENQRVGRLVDEFLYELERNNTEEIREYDVRFRNLCKRTEAVIGMINPTFKAHVFLKKCKLPEMMKSQIIS